MINNLLRYPDFPNIFGSLYAQTLQSGKLADDPEQIEECVAKLGADDYLTKPFDLDGVDHPNRGE